MIARMLLRALAPLHRAIQVYVEKDGTMMKKLPLKKFFRSEKMGVITHEAILDMSTLGEETGGAR